MMTFLGTESVRPSGRADRDPAPRRADGGGESDLGVHADRRSAEEYRPSRGPDDHRPHLEVPGDSPGARAADLLADVSAGPLGRHCRGLFLHDRRLECCFRGLFAYNFFQFCDEIDVQPTVWPQSLSKRFAPRAQVVFVFVEERPDEALECLRQSGIRNVALVLIELS